ncbi:DNA translocase FtsK [Patiriisocius marinistellae]|uniref:DNA translocase FtsK n=1 Tax=Patiriisocius marinistellae TaxID=2494560 RepID=A0A5J4FY52_9FLAO|nr:DNA translocase FtsK [Patiriisocius marinistellae]
MLGLALLFSFVSYFFTWQADQSIIGLADRNVESKNWLSKFGSNIAHFFIYDGFGISSFIFATLVTLTGVYLFFDYTKKQLKKFWFWGILLMIWFSIFFGFFHIKNSLLSGVIGYEINDLSQDYIGLTGTILLMIFLAIIYLVVRLKITPELVANTFQKTKKSIAKDFSSQDGTSEIKKPENKLNNTPTVETSFETSKISEEITTSPTPETTTPIVSTEEFQVEIPEEEEMEMKVEEVTEEKEGKKNLSDKLVADFGEFDPTLELSGYKFPTIELLKDYTAGQGITINQEELEENKNRIVETLNNYKIGIASIKATVGPTVTLYEIVPEAGIRISKIKNLEDDIALSLSALGIRIIAPIPGRGTIGIEVPNKNPKTVSMRSTIASPKFQSAEMELPLGLGKTISNETFVVDLAKMPHLLMAGATGQGKSVGLNAILTSLLYKKHPAEVKFVLVDPKKVELTLFNKIERHFLAKLPGDEDAIITDTNKVITTLNSLCIEMDQRYDLLKDAYVRNIKEYNDKFKARKLNPEEGHKFLPYIVLVIDEFADLIMTAGKEVETPIARLAQLARAIGIHLIVATQRPSVNVITGIIKANFPARIAFRVTSKIDSRTILDSGGADQLIGRGDMLYTQGNELVRIQCAFVDTPEVADITDFIGGQKAYPDAHILPEYIGEEGGTTLDNNINERDALFRDAAEVLVIAQQGSASLLQRKLKLGYNRAGRIIDQLEAAGIVGPFEGSKARQVTVPTIEALNQLLDSE